MMLLIYRYASNIKSEKAGIVRQDETRLHKIDTNTILCKYIVFFVKVRAGSSFRRPCRGRGIWNAETNYNFQGIDTTRDP